MSTPDHFSTQKALIDDLLLWIRKTADPKAQMLQTHVSWVLLHGEKAWKIKKAITLPFLDFSTLKLRKRYCTREVKMNRESAGDLYTGVRKLSRNSAGEFCVDGKNRALEYMVEMRRFDQSALLSNRLRANKNGVDGGLGRAQIARLSRHIGQFHLSCPASADTASGSFEATEQEITDNFTALEQASPNTRQARLLARVRRQNLAELRSLRPLIDSRRTDGSVRVCHGDLHLGNLLWLDNQPVMFDRIEFSADFSEIDVVKDLAFLYMDLISHGRVDMASLLIDIWTQTTGDYDGLRLLRLYACYRAMVRAKIAAIESAQRPGDKAARAEVWRRLSLAGCFLKPKQNSLVLMHGATGTGKSWYAGRIACASGAVLLHSDVVRKQLLGLPVERIKDTEALWHAYGQEVTEKTYERLLTLAQSFLDGGCSVVIDATFLKRDHRAPFTELAARAKAECVIASPQCRIDTQAQRLHLRENAQGNGRGAQTADALKEVSDGNAAVMGLQARVAEPLDESEQALEMRIPEAQAIDLARFKAINPIFQLFPTARSDFSDGENTGGQSSGE